MKNKDLISIIIPVYNEEIHLERCINSIINQTYKNMESILVNDGSTDQSGEICDKIAKNDKRIKVIHKKNSGVSDTRNMGINNANGKYITFIDSDDYIDNKMIEKLYINLKENESDISICGFKRINEKKQILYETKTKKINLNKREFLDELMIEKIFIGSLWGKLYKKEFFEKNKLDKKLRIAEDLDLLIRIGEESKKISVLGENLYYYYDNAKSVTKNSNFEKYSDELKVLEKNFNNKNISKKLIYSRYLKLNTCLFYNFRKNDKENAEYCKKIIKNTQLNKGLNNYFTFKQKIKYLLVKINIIR